MYSDYFYFLIYKMRIKGHLSEFLCGLNEQLYGRDLTECLVQGQVCCCNVFWNISTQTWAFVDVLQLRVPAANLSKVRPSSEST